MIYELFFLFNINLLLSILVIKMVSSHTCGSYMVLQLQSFNYPFSSVSPLVGPFSPACCATSARELLTNCSPMLDGVFNSK